MSTNNNHETLFRFINLRNPNLVETDRDNFKFIQRPERMEGVFDQVITAQSQARYNALLDAAANFEPDSIKNIEELETGVFNNLMKIGKSISKQEKLTADELTICKNDYQSISVRSENVKDIWDNFIYQFLTQKDFYLKEVLAYIIKALHVGYVQTLNATVERKKINETDDFVSIALNAIIVIPSSIFNKESEAINSIGSNQKISMRNNTLMAMESEKFEKEQYSIIEKENLIQLKKELVSIRNNYNKNYNKALKLAQEKYNKDNGVTILAYQKQLDIIEQLEENKATEAELKIAYDALSRIELPSFNFKYKKELNWEDIQTQLSTISFAFFLQNFTSETIESEIDLTNAEIEFNSDDELSINDNLFTFNSDSYNEIFEKIENHISIINERVLRESFLPQDEFVNIGGTLIPVSKNTTNKLPHLSYSLSSSFLISNFFTVFRYIAFQINVESSSWSVSHAIVTANTNFGIETQAIGSIQVVNNKLSFPHILKDKYTSITNMSIQVFFTNGRETTLNLPADNNLFNIEEKTSTIISGILSLKELNIGNPVENTPTNDKHYGLKRLGVAEYMKVVQSVHAYIPGEVSNIENVMASELRHKSISELTRTEDTITTQKTQEVEKISDTTKVNRSEMQTEVAKEIDKLTSFNAHANFSKEKIWKIDIGTAYASSNAQFISNRQVVTKSQEVTEKAMERVQSKISEERISKIIHEVNLTNVHEYDNRGKVTETDNAEAARPQHITGVYRWVDKKMKNQIYNYGKRTMFEFMIPEPARLHRIATAIKGNTIVAPVDPRTAEAPHKMPNASTATNELLEYWANIYGVTLTELPQQNKEVYHEIKGTPNSFQQFNPVSTALSIETNYTATSLKIGYYVKKKLFIGQSMLTCSDCKGGNVSFQSYNSSYDGTTTINGLNYFGENVFMYNGINIYEFTLYLTFYCKLSDEFINAWKLENFNLIIEAYTNALAEHNENVAAIESEQNAKQEEQKDIISNFYRIIEGDVLKHNCIAYLLQNYLSGIGEDFDHDGEGVKMEDFKVILSEDLDKYTSTAKFLEQAFEWSTKDYTFYPYFWAERSQWQELYLTENVDPLFRSFLQSGMARVIVTVKPGFEEAVQYFLETGKVWMGGESPIIGDPLYMSIAAEMIEPTGLPQGKFWITRIPTTLTIIQAHSTGLDADPNKPLPIFPETEPENCENPDQLEVDTAFTLQENAQLLGTGTSDTTLYPN
ncbi:hypothetical protein [Flavobacterium sp.]|uniref:hypothetical protein n=1 Tax=Flavobacterium sp. TaxID=239 RepID=UPI002B4B14CA|nr:hypothetical protein [Flavobacterium sp.]HLP65513.1 hypothetical protein [Flavobacterium sp.]